MAPETGRASGCRVKSTARGQECARVLIKNFSRILKLSRWTTRIHKLCSHETSTLRRLSSRWTEVPAGWRALGAGTAGGVPPA